MSSVPKLLPGGRLAYERAIRYSSLPAPARHLALTIATWADIETGVIPDRFQPSQSTLEEATGLSRGSVYKFSKVLEDEGWLVRQGGGGRTHRTRHVLRIPPGAVTSRRGNMSPDDRFEQDGNVSPYDRFQGNVSCGAQETCREADGNVSPHDTKSPPSTDESPPPSPPAEERAAEDGREGGRALSPEDQTALDALAQAIAGEPRLTVGEFEAIRLIPLVRPWLERASPEQLRSALTAGLPAQVGSPVGLLRRRLLEKLPAARTAESAPTNSLPAWCGSCGDEEPAAEFNAKLRRTRTGEPCPACHPDIAAAA